MLGWFTLDADAPAGAADRLLAALCARLSGAGMRIAGAVQVNTDRGGDCACDMDVTVFGDGGAPIRISQSLGAGSTGCRLDPGALEIAAARVSAAMAGADLVILPKFGRQEAMGRGFRSVIGEALSEGIPVLLHVPPDQRAAFAAFAEGMGEELTPEALDGWCLEQAAGVS